MDGTVLGQGTFTQGSTATAQTIMIPSGCDYLQVYNFTQAGDTNGNGYKFYWQYGMGTQGIYELTTTGSEVEAGVTATGAFVAYNPNNPTVYALNNGSTGISAISGATPPVATVGSTSGMSAGMVVRLTSLVSTANANLAFYNGMDFSVGYGTLNSTHFSIDYLNTYTTTTTGNFRVIGFPIITTNGLGIITSDGLFYPRRRYITNITAASSAVITLSVQHNFTVGQEIRLQLPGGSAVWGNYAALDNYTYSPQNTSTAPDSWIITAVNTATGNGNNTITINANTTGFGTFAYPTATATTYPFTPAAVIPFGEDTATALAQTPPLSSLADSVQNVGFLGMTLAAGALLPAGSANDVIYWVAGKSTYGGQ